MRKLFFACAIVLGSFSLYSCGGNDGAGSDEGTVIDRDTTVSELEVEETTMDIDTTMETQTETIEPGTEMEH
ncbi:hypothetical protein [Botryobacter ruber]|uniref:hypothetical protein n=1 Tax=Botryobacter ruber TaxID=2171629 RepID=UPI000F64D8F0|nr:hypothetical protein [Botryobacter ruber]